MRFNLHHGTIFRLAVLPLVVALGACDGDAANGRDDAGGIDAAGPDASGRDAGAPDAERADARAPDGGADDASEPSDAGTEADATMEQDACVPPPCAAPPPGCDYVGSDPCACGTLVCDSECDGEICGLTEYCDYDADFACGGPGSCQPRPEGCLAIFDPVCGCDGETHSNGCVANANGTDVAADGECGPTTADCRTTGCMRPRTCEECRGIGGPVYVCLPPGTAC